MPVTSQPSSEIPCVSQPARSFYSVDWSGGVDVDVDNDRMIIDVCVCSIPEFREGRPTGSGP